MVTGVCGTVVMSLASIARRSCMRKEASGSWAWGAADVKGRNFIKAREKPLLRIGTAIRPGQWNPFHTKLQLRTLHPSRPNRWNDRCKLHFSRWVHRPCVLCCAILQFSREKKTKKHLKKKKIGCCFCINVIRFTHFFFTERWTFRNLHKKKKSKNHCNLCVFLS